MKRQHSQFSDGEVLIVDAAERTDNLVREMIDVLTGMCARLYGQRGARHRAVRLVAAAENTVTEMTYAPV